VVNVALNADLDAANHLADVTNECATVTPRPASCPEDLKKAADAVKAADKVYADAKAVLATDKTALDSAAADQKGAQQAYTQAVANEKAELAKLNSAISAANSAQAAAQAELASILSQCPQKVAPATTTLKVVKAGRRFGTFHSTASM